MVYVLKSNGQLEELKRRLVREIAGLERESNRVQNRPSSFNIIVDKKISLINWILDIIESNSRITIEELADHIDYRIEGVEREIDDAEIGELDWIFDELKILDWIRSAVRMVGQIMMY
jgi:hypothetical protein